MSQTQTLTPRTSRLLDIQGFDTVDVQELARVAPWLRLSFGLCTLLGGLGSVLIFGWPPARDAQQEG